MSCGESNDEEVTQQGAKKVELDPRTRTSIVEEQGGVSRRDA